jgi:hypothetical protein
MAVTDEQTAAEALTLADRLGTLSEEREKFWAEAPQRDDLLGETLRGLGGMGYLVTGQVADVEQGGLIGAMKSLAWYAQNTPDKLAAVSQRLSTSGRGPIAEMVKAWLWVQEAKPDNLVVNGGFEDGTPNRAEAEMDWRTEGAPQGWSIWSATADTKFETLGGQGQEGSAAASISRGQSACYLQSHPVQAGEKYLCVCWVKADPPELSCGAYLGIRFRDPKGAWHERRDLEPTVSVAEGQPGWQPLVVMVTAPEGAGSLLVMPGARGQAEGGRALFDNVALYRVTLGH